MSVRQQDRWQSRTTFVLALSASAVSLGNLWRFSYLAGEHGGAPFVAAYVLCLVLLAVPVLVAEVVLGSHGRGGPVKAIVQAADRSLRWRGWGALGVLACITGVLVLTFYVVVAGWGIAYIGFMYDGTFASARAGEVGEHFERFLASPRSQVYWLSVFLMMTSAVVIIGVRRGLGLLVWLIVPGLIALLGFLITFGFDNGDMAATREFLFSTRAIDFTPNAALAALGHAFFTLGVGVGTGICYGAYAPERIPIGRSVVAVAVFDTVVGLLAGLAIFPIVFANNMEPAVGPGLLFVSLPYAFGNIMQGELFGAGFFTLMVIAAWGSAVAIMEPVVAAVSQALRLSRFTAVMLVGSLVWLLCLAVVASFDPFAQAQWFGNRNLFAILDTLTAETLLPLVSLLTAIFVGWRIRPEILKLQLDRESGIFFWLWRFSLRFVVPPAIVLLMLAPLFLWQM
ncbi:MAG: sodium-dependent transporter [Halioglobus sp.]